MYSTLLKENLLLLKDLLELYKLRITNMWHLCQKKVYFDVLDEAYEC